MQKKNSLGAADDFGFRLHIRLLKIFFSDTFKERKSKTTLTHHGESFKID